MIRTHLRRVLVHRTYPAFVAWTCPGGPTPAPVVIRAYLRCAWASHRVIQTASQRGAISSLSAICPLTTTSSWTTGTCLSLWRRGYSLLFYHVTRMSRAHMGWDVPFAASSAKSPWVKCGWGRARFWEWGVGEAQQRLVSILGKKMKAWVIVGGWRCKGGFACPLPSSRSDQIACPLPSSRSDHKTRPNFLQPYYMGDSLSLSLVFWV